MLTTLKHASLLMLSLSLLVGSNKAEADLITALDSSFALTAQAQSEYSNTVTDTDAQSQGPTINPLNVAVQAVALYPPYNWSVVTRGNGSATWSIPSQGQVLFTNLGWTTVGGNGAANLASNTGWTYSFTSNVTGSFVINYNVTAQDTVSVGAPPLFGLNGFYIYGAEGVTPPSNDILLTGLNTSGTVSFGITVGDTQQFPAAQPRLVLSLPF